MPSYDYECTVCGHRFEMFQSMSEPPLTECPQCGKRVRRLIGGGMGIIFKGSGFYVTDNRKSSSIGSKPAESKLPTPTVLKRKKASILPQRRSLELHPG
jgi:putative FmdB family regulatory protein